MQISDSLDRDERTRLTSEVIAVCIVGVYEKLAYHYLLWSGKNFNIMEIADDAVTIISGGISGLLSKISDLPGEPGD